MSKTPIIGHDPRVLEIMVFVDRIRYGERLLTEVKWSPPAGFGKEQASPLEGDILRFIKSAEQEILGRLATIHEERPR